MTHYNLEKLAYQRQLVGAGIGALVGGGAGYASVGDRGADETDDDHASRRRLRAALGALGGGLVGAGIAHMGRSGAPAPKPAPKPPQSIEVMDTKPRVATAPVQRAATAPVQRAATAPTVAPAAAVQPTDSDRRAVARTLRRADRVKLEPTELEEMKEILSRTDSKLVRTRMGQLMNTHQAVVVPRDYNPVLTPRRAAAIPAWEPPKGPQPRAPGSPAA